MLKMYSNEKYEYSYLYLYYYNDSRRILKKILVISFAIIISVGFVNFAFSSSDFVISVGSRPQSIIINEITKKAYVTNHDSNNVSVIDLTTNTAISKIRVADSPYELAIDVKNNKIYVASPEGLSIIDGKTDKFLKTIEIERNPSKMIMDGKFQQLYVFHPDVHKITVVDVNSDTITNVIDTYSQEIAKLSDQLSLPRDAELIIDDQNIYVIDRSLVPRTHPVVNSALNQIYASNFNDIIIYDLNTFEKIDFIYIGGETKDLKINSSKSKLYALTNDGIREIDLNTKRILKNYDAQHVAQKMIIYNNSIYLVNSQSNSVSIISLLPDVDQSPLSRTPEIHIMLGSNQGSCLTTLSCYDSVWSSPIPRYDVFIDKIYPGDKVVFINDDNAVHSIRIDSRCGSTEFRSGHIKPGESALFTARFPGEIGFYDELFPKNRGSLKIELNENVPLTVYTDTPIKKYSDKITLFVHVPIKFQKGGNVEIKLFDQNNKIVEEGTSLAVFGQNIYRCFDDQIPGGFYSFSTASNWQNGKYKVKASYDGFESETYFTVDNSISSKFGNVSFTMDKKEYQKDDKIHVEGIVNPIVEKYPKAKLIGQVTYPNGSNLIAFPIVFDPIDGSFDFEVDTSEEYHWGVDGEYTMILEYDGSNSYTPFLFMAKSDSQTIESEPIYVPTEPETIQEPKAVPEPIPESNFDLQVIIESEVYDLSDTATMNFSIDGITPQNVALEVFGPSGTTVISRSFMVDSEGIPFEFRIDENFKAGTYKVVATTSDNGNTITDTVYFKVKSQYNSFKITSVQVTDQQGNPSNLQAGEMGFIKVNLEASKSITTLVTVNLFDSDLTSIGIGSIKTTLSSGNSENILSFMIPSDVSVGSSNIFVNAFSDWPSNGGIPLTGEISVVENIK